ncbi:hypothetical protein MNEG_2542 [Monoraphidium neglectum]|jgi:hypothetical protein|uniref:MYND-type domain-containing protein n=1 Tax=Monoraphidium neglectum TaxID=145388 RepID=A0A0D2MYG7_9CHLO|nr:hypothetical protein MNEG_2542 [Monoraphidium neglectum]KIZ05407.1 hypothetical protein MNEG_2542 [Monoraphidium neglectum]|eukprot:XP_013904426.1 hypothetical protein MNEG_2542 [Monoraphidium neglectum]
MRTHAPARRLSAADTACDQLGDEALVAAAPWFHSDHLVGPGPLPGAPSEAAPGGGGGRDDGVCDWCGGACVGGYEVGRGGRGGGGGGGGGGGEGEGDVPRGCAACGCARYCGAACTRAAAPLHARNCWRLKLLSAKGVAARWVPDPERPAFDYGDDLI